ETDREQAIVGIPIHRFAVLLENLLLSLQVLEVAAEPVSDIAVLREKPEGPPLAAAPDQDLRATGLDRPRHVERAIDPVVLALEGRPLLGEHEPGDRQRFVEPVHALRDRRQLNTVAVSLVL